ncbi:MAG: PASTA domain-containing protein, partial [Chlorobiaceae bacterium]|nr:PASTA domain-containing protein [Chlorobiaceae bacterium]
MVSFVVSLGPEMVTVPDVTGMAQGQAQAAITAASLSVGTITEAASTTVPPGNVISQSPTGGTSVPLGSLVSLVISTGPSTIPP